MSLSVPVTSEGAKPSKVSTLELQSHRSSEAPTNIRREINSMAQFRAKRLDLGGFVNIKIIRDHTKRKVFEKFEPER